MENYEIDTPEIIKKCKGYTLKLTHPSIKKNHEYQIRAFRRVNGKYGEFFMLYCYLPKCNLYQRIFSNTKLSKCLMDSISFWTRYEPHEDDTMIWNEDTKKIMKFYPGEIGHWNGNDYRKIVFDIEEA